ncbi:dTMP kinase [Naumannella huperziae]
MGPGAGAVRVSGVFVVFEGGDGVGKSTQQKLLAQRLAAAGVPHVVTRQPGGTAAGQRIRELLLDPTTGDLDPRAEALLYAADKAQHVGEVIRPALERGEVVVSDRYVDSLLAYQGAGRVLRAEEVAAVAAWATDGLRADLTVLLDLEPGAGVGAKADKDRIEAAGDAFHERVREGFLALAAAHPAHYLVLPARHSREQIAEQVWRRLAELLSEPAGRLDP